YPPRAAKRARDIFTRLGRAEAKVHNIDVERVHFHEVGAIDSIMDIVGSCLALEMLGVDRVICSPLPVGKGVVRAQHGLLPVPAPATAELLVGAQTVESSLQAEALTPTGAAILTTLSESYGPMPAMEVSAVGYGAGTRTEGEMPNLLRVCLGRPSGDGDADTVVELSCNLDDCTGEIVGAAIESLLTGGALDAWAAPIVMKKSRPAYMLCALCDPCDAPGIERMLFTQTTTFGVRRRLCRRSKLRRRHETVQTPYGPIRVKVGSLADEEITAAPEYSDCLTAAQSHHVSLREVMRAAVQATHKDRS
ncbi:MAG TPA: nickel pincer cofactor biosynthesis protein LarC, partial [Phycisphaerae bacterium]|nr:nickel pincer cofactor biosynthesis protein LarC [Phycisphaerae bacterium]